MKHRDLLILTPKHRVEVKSKKVHRNKEVKGIKKSKKEHENTIILEKKNHKSKHLDLTASRLTNEEIFTRNLLNQNN